MACDLISMLKMHWEEPGNVRQFRQIFSMPERLICIISGKMTKAQAIMLHRVLFGSVERFLGILNRTLCREIPLWLSPIQVRIITVNDDFNGKLKNLPKTKNTR